MTEAFLPLIDTNGGRIVNVGSGAGPMYVKKLEDQATIDFLSSGKPNWAELEAYASKMVQELDMGLGVYGLSKAIVHKYTEIIARENPSLMVSAVSPGFIDTNMTKGFGATKTPDDGALPIIHCLVGDLKESGCYYGSDCERSPLHYMRNPGEPVFTGYAKL